MGCFIAADLGYSFLTLQNAYTGQQWPGTLWPLATLLFAGAAVQASVPSKTAPQPAPPSLWACAP